MPELDLSQAEAGALQYLQGLGDGGGATPQDSATPEGQAGAAGDPGSEQPAPQAVQLPDDAIVELEVGGQKVTKPWKQARAEMMLHADYTRKRQAEAKIVEEAENLRQRLQKRDAAYQELIADPRNILALYEAVTGQRLQAPEVRQPSPDELVTYQDVINFLEAQKREAAQFVESKFQEFQDAQFVSDVERTTSSTINAVLNENKQILQFYDQNEAEVLLKRMAREKKAATVEELRDALVDAGKRLAERVDARLKEIRKESAVKQTHLTKRGIEPGGGTPVPAQSKAYGDGRSVNWSEIDKDAQAFIESRLSS